MVNSDIDAKTSKILTQTYAIVSTGFVTFGAGLFFSQYINPIAAAAICVAAFISAFMMLCTTSSNLKMCYISLFAFGIGLSGGYYCQRYQLVDKEIVLVALCTIAIFVGVTVAAFFSRNLYVFYGVALVGCSFLYLVSAIYFLFTWGMTTLFFLFSLTFVMDVIVLLMDTQKIIALIENGQTDPFPLSFILLSDAFEIFIDLVKIVSSLKKDKNEK
ncbi:hypothetical protein EIN_018690 [Entamoeba invadens IP1]|uniref:Bax inhibitor n=1 Tax=Entamoeba invadens TaxID=33085 RepID=S0B2T6_ENTIV|nr:hypothetical protein EIN_018690 [Entamoeba invadens IP1]ELP90510.1 hypothetical protein EIN_018690 [Entamoeba invadens IP1]BAN41768.1 hypothetical protein, conserved [Entamoeba invadens]|eukprot:XP_004257281.1 hypothetical protein EIN_018690 [Entamoeba invadens IP1]